MSYLARLKARIAEKLPPGELTELTEGASVSFVGAHGGHIYPTDNENDVLPESIEGAIEERVAICVARVPAPYLETWARLNHQTPRSVSDEEWRVVLDDAGHFFDVWGEDAVALHWCAGELLDVPSLGRKGGLIWQLRGARVEALGVEHMRLDDGRVIAREEPRE